MRADKSLIRSLAGFTCGLFSFLLFIPAGFGLWLGLACAFTAITLGRFGKPQSKPQNKVQEILSFGGILLASAAGLLFLGVHLL